MKITKAVLCPERVRQVPEQFSWVDQALVQRHLIDHCDSHSAALYLFLITVADAQGLSYYSNATLAARLHLSTEELALARQQLIELALIAYQAPLYQVLAIAFTQGASPRTPKAAVPAPAAALSSSTASSATASTTALTPAPRPGGHAGAISLAQLIELERRHARL